MSIKTTSKVVAAAVGFTMALGLFAAVGVSSASAQSMTATQLINLLIAAGVIPADKAAAALAAVGGSATASATTFTKDLTIGSTGADVTALQNVLGVSPATGYFGSITKAAVVAYQKAHGISSTGYFGPLTRASVNSSSAMTTTTTTTTTTTGTTPVVNSGVEGTLTVQAGPVPNSTLYEGQTKVPVLSLRVQAQVSDIAIQRVKLNLGTNSNVYTKIMKSLYVLDDSGKVLGYADLNSNTVVKDGSNYVLTLGGFSYNVAKDTTKYLTVAADLYSSINTQSYGSATIALVDDGVRGTDGAGLDQYAPTTGFSNTVTISTSLVDSADLKISTDSSTPATGAIIANSGALNNEADKVPVLVFSAKAEKDNIGITDLSASTTLTSGTIIAAYLYDGSTLVQSGTVSAGNVNFTNIGGSLGYIVPKDTTKQFTLKVDIRNATDNPGTLAASIPAYAVSAVNSEGSSVSSVSGSATANTLTVQKAGPVFTLSGTPSISKSVIGQTASSTFATSFTFNVAAHGTDVAIAKTGAVEIGIYVNGSKVSTGTSTLAASYEKPTSGVTDDGTNYVIADGSSANFTVRASFTGPNGVYVPAGGIVTARVEKVYWNSNSTSYISDTFRASGDASGNVVTL